MTSIMDLFGESETYKAGETIIREGETGRDIYALTNGVIEVSMADDKGNYVLNEMQPPDLLGEISFLDGSPRTATATAKTDVEVYVLRYEKMRKEMDDIPVLFKLIIKAFTKRVRACDEQIKKLENEIERLRS